MIDLEKQRMKVHNLQIKLQVASEVLKHSPPGNPITKLFEEQTLVMTEELLTLTGKYN